MNIGEYAKTSLYLKSRIYFLRSFKAGSVYNKKRLMVVIETDFAYDGSIALGVNFHEEA